MPDGPFHALMSRPALPDEIRRFVLTSIPSVPYLEAMLLLRSEPGAVWNAARLARRLYVPESDAQQLLAALQGGGVARLDESNALEYSPTPELARVIEMLAQCYAQNLMGITELIHARTDRRALQFADAFRLKKPGA